MYNASNSKSRQAPRLLALVTVGALALATAGCAGDSESGGSDADTLTMGLSNEPSTLDVQMDDSALQFEPLNNVYEALTKGGTKAGEILPSLATEWEQVDPVTWRFTLRDGVTFQDGEEFNPDAVVFSVERALTPTSTTLGDYPLLTGAKSDGENSVLLTTSSAEPNLPLQLTLLPMVPPKYVTDSEQDFLTSKGVGTGAYEWVSYKPGQSVELKANPDWWGGEPAYDKVEFKIITDTNVRVQALQAGEIDFATGLDPASVDLAPKVFSLPSNTVCGLRINAQEGLFTSLEARQAANYALDRQQIADQLFGSDYAAPANGQMVTSASFGYNPDLKDYPFDVDQAKSLLAQSGYDGHKISVVSPSGHWTGDRELISAAVNQLQAAGFNVEAKFVEYTVWRDAYTVRPPSEDIVLICASDDSLDGSKPLVNLGTSTGGTTAFGSPETDAEIEQALSEADLDARSAAVQAAWSSLKDQAWMVPIVSVNSIYGGRDGVEWKAPVNGKAYANDITLPGN